MPVTAHAVDYVSPALLPRKPEAGNVAEHVSIASYKDHRTTIDDTIEHVVRGHYAGDKVPQLAHSVSPLFQHFFIHYN